MTIERVAVADSGPLVALARIELLELLPRLYGRVAIPGAVFNELTEGAAEGRAGASDVRAAAWIEVVEVDAIDAEPHTLVVDRGEAEAIALARRAPGSSAAHR